MISVKEVTKRFGQIYALQNLTLDIPDNEVFGLVGTNGAGKSTLLRIMAGILKADCGEVQVNGQYVYENPEQKADICYISDEAYFFANANPAEMGAFYRVIYPEFDRNRYQCLLEQFSLSEDRKIQTFSKGMKKQLSVILGLCSGARYLLCDETFDGLDPVMRQAVKSLFANELLNRPFTPVVASHNLRELEDICEHVGLMHEGGILLSRDLEEMKQDIHKLQCVVKDEAKEELLLRNLNVVNLKRQGSLLLITVRGSREEIRAKAMEAEPIFCEIIPLSLEEIFISETEVTGYEVKNLLL